MVLRQLAESDTWEAVAGVFDATVAASRYVQQQQQEMHVIREREREMRAHTHTHTSVSIMTDDHSLV
jgi:hypothetical protein